MLFLAGWWEEGEGDDVVFDDMVIWCSVMPVIRIKKLVGQEIFENPEALGTR